MNISRKKRYFVDEIKGTFHSAERLSFGEKIKNSGHKLKEQHKNVKKGS